MKFDPIWLNIQDHKPAPGQRIFIREIGNAPHLWIGVIYYEPGAEVDWHLWSHTDERSFKGAPKLADEIESLKKKCAHMTDEQIEEYNSKMLYPIRKTNK